MGRSFQCLARSNLPVWLPVKPIIRLNLSKSFRVGYWATLPLLRVAKCPPTSQPLNVAPTQRRIVSSLDDDNKLPLLVIGCCRGKTSRSRALLVSTHAPLQLGRHVS